MFFILCFFAERSILLGCLLISFKSFLKMGTFMGASWLGALFLLSSSPCSTAP